MEFDREKRVQLGEYAARLLGLRIGSEEKLEDLGAAIFQDYGAFRKYVAEADKAVLIAAMESGRLPEEGSVFLDHPITAKAAARYIERISAGPIDPDEMFYSDDFTTTALQEMERYGKSTDYILREVNAPLCLEKQVQLLNHARGVRLCSDREAVEALMDDVKVRKIEGRVIEGELG